MGLGDQATNLFVYCLSDFLTIIALFSDLLPQENQFLLVAEGQRSQPIAHAVLGDHLPGQACGTLKVVARSRSYIVEDELLGRSPS